VKVTVLFVDATEPQPETVAAIRAIAGDDCHIERCADPSAARTRARECAAAGETAPLIIFGSILARQRPDASRSPGWEAAALRRVNELENDPRQNLFIRSILHSLINLLQVQLSLDKEENATVGEMGGLFETFCQEQPEAASSEDLCHTMRTELFPRLLAVREKIDENMHHALMDYVKGVQRLLLGKSGFSSGRPTNLCQTVERVRAKYAEFFSGEMTGAPVEFIVDLPGTEVMVPVFDFVLVTLLERLLTCSLRRVLLPESAGRRIRLSAAEERMEGEPFIVLHWADNGPAVPDSDESGFPAAAVLPVIRLAVESSGGFIRPAPGPGMALTAGFPRLPSR
jgi:hypothetical protein